MPKNYRATAASIRTAYGHRLRPADYRELTALHSVPEVVAYLKETPAYSEVLSGLEPSITHRGYVEMLLRRNLFTQCIHFCGMEQLRKAPFFRFFLYEYEIRELFRAIRLGPQGYISAMDTWLAPYLVFSQEKLARAETREDIINVCAHTMYAPILRKYLSKNAEPVNYTELEIALRACCLSQILQEAASALTGSDLDALRELIGEQVDLINLINAYRLKSVFHTDRDTLRGMMLPIAGKLPKRILEQLYDAPDLAAFDDVLSGTRYGRLMDDLPDTPDSMRVELAFQTLRGRTARAKLHFSGHAAVSMYAYHILNRIEIENLITIIEGIRYQKPVSDIQSLLVITEPS